MYIEDKGSSLRDKGQAGKPRSFAHCQTRSQATIQRGSVSSFVSLVGRGSTIVCLLVIDKRWGLLLHHELNELVIVNTAVPVLVSLANHLIHLVVRQLLAN